MSPAQQGILVISTLNEHLPTLSDFFEPDKWLDPAGCCPDCCAPCSVVRELDHEGKLDAIVTAAPKHLWDNHAWWKDSSVDRTWLYSVFSCPNYCDEGNLVSERLSQNDPDRRELVVAQLRKEFHVQEADANEMIDERLAFEKKFYGDE